LDKAWTPKSEALGFVELLEQVFYSPDAIRVTQSAASKHCL